MGGATRVSAQDASHFIYLQSDTKQPFFVKLSPSADPLNSSGSGYLILPKVPQGSFSFWVGFPDKSYPDQHFVCSINADKGFMLKHFPEKGWALYDLQELTLTYTAGTDSAAHTIPPVAPPDTAAKAQPQTAPATVATTPVNTAPATSAVTSAPAQPQPADTPKTQASAPETPAQDTPVAPKPADAFGDALVAVTRDTTLRDVKKIAKKVPPPIQPAPVAAVEPANIVLVSRQVTDTAVQLVYADRQASGAIDTVQVLMNQAPPANAPAVDTQAATAAVTTSPAPAAAPDSAKAVPTPPDTNAAKTVATIDTPAAAPAITPVDTSHAFNPASLKAKDTSNLVVPVFKQQSQSTDSSRGNLAAGFGIQPTAPAATTAAATTSAAATTPPATTATTGDAGKDVHLANANCNRVAGDEDYQRLRKKMASESDVDRMIDLAKKAFKKTCYTTDQVRSLSFLFLQEEGRYKFIEEAYPFVSDSWNFNSLQSLFSSVYYINRFKALVQH